MRKVLMIAQYFPPAGSIGTVRVTKFVKYLQEFGWKPIVLTMRPDCYPNNVWMDQGLVKDIPENVAVYRTGILRTRVINDKGIRWIPYLLPAMAKVIKKENPQLIYLTAGPFFPLIAGPFIKFFLKRPYVVDLRDPWKLARRALPLHGLKARLGKLLTDACEPFVLKYAAKIICVNEYMCEEYRKAYPELSDKFVAIPNGYDLDDINTVVPQRFTKFTVVYTGKFRTAEAFRDPTAFFQALKICRQRDYDIQFIHVGAIEQEVINIVKQIGVSDLVRFIGSRPYSEALAYAKGANVLLLIGGGQRTEQTGKVFDYIACGRPILALAPLDGGIAEVLRNINFARLIPNNDPEMIARTLKEMYHNPNDGSQLILPEKYDRRLLTGSLARIFDEVTSEARFDKVNILEI